MYREVTTTIHLNPSRITKTTKVVTVDVQTVTFTGTEKIERVWVEDDSGNPTLLQPVFLQELRAENPASSDDPRRYAILSVASNTVTILLDTVPATAFTLFADVHAELADLSGSNEPAFPESYHDIIVAGVLVKEYRRKNQRDLARDEMVTYDARIGDLRFWMAKEIALKVRARDAKSPVSTSSSGGGAGSATLGQTAYTQTGLITFDRDPSAPFAVTASSAKVDNLDADLLDGLNSTAFALSADSIVAGAGLTGGGTLAASRTLDVGAGTYITVNANDVAVDAAAIKAGIKVDEWAAPTDVTTHNASTSAHGFSPKATAPAAGLLSVLAIGNGATVRSDTAIFDTTNPAALGTVGPGTALVAARRDHIHANPAIDTLAAATDITTLNATTSAHGLMPKGTGSTTTFFRSDMTQAAPPSGAVTLLGGGSGTDTNVAAANMATVAISGLTALDRLKVVWSVTTVTQQTANIILYDNTGTTAITAARTLAAGETLVQEAIILDRQAGVTNWWSSTFGFIDATAANGASSYGGATDWTSSWTLALRHGGVTAGGTAQYTWSVYKLAGQ